MNGPMFQPAGGNPDSSSPPAAPAGTCPTCGATELRLRYGRIPWHRQQRIRSGDNGQPQQYETPDPCDGERERPDVEASGRPYRANQAGKQLRAKTSQPTT